jgi:hypothetical protein
VGLFLDCSERGHLEARVGSLRVEVWHVSESLAEEMCGVGQVLRIMGLVFYAAEEVVDCAAEVRGGRGGIVQW